MPEGQAIGMISRVTTDSKNAALLNVYSGTERIGAGYASYTLDAGRWRKVWEGRRATDRSELFQLYRRVDTADAPAAP